MRKTVKRVAVLATAFTVTMSSVMGVDAADLRNVASVTGDSKYSKWVYPGNIIGSYMAPGDQMEPTIKLPSSFSKFLKKNLVSCRKL